MACFTLLMALMLPFPRYGYLPLSFRRLTPKPLLTRVIAWLIVSVRSCVLVSLNGPYWELA